MGTNIAEFRGGTRAALLAGVAVTALAFGVPSQAAAEASDPKRGFFAVVEGGFVFGEGDSQPWAENVQDGTAPDLSPSDGFRGRVGFGGYVSRDTSLAIYISGLGGQSETSTAYSSGASLYNILGGNYATFYFTGNAKQEQNLIIADFEARHDVGLGEDMGFELSLSGGLRFIDFEQTTDTVFFFSPAFILRENRNAEFEGLGPRAGIHGKVPLGGGFSIGADVNGAFIYGLQKVRVTTTGGLGGVGNTVRVKDSKGVINVDGALSVAYAIPDSAISIASGYQVDAFYGILDTRNTVSITGSNFGGQNDDLIYHGPFIRATVNF